MGFVWPVAYGGGPEGGYVHFFRAREHGWHSGRRGWGAEASYTMIRDGQMAYTWIDGAERVGKLPTNWGAAGLGRRRRARDGDGFRRPHDAGRALLDELARPAGQATFREAPFVPLVATKWVDPDMT